MLDENFLYSRPISFFPFAQMESMCMDQDKSDEIRTPKYLKQELWRIPEISLS